MIKDKKNDDGIVTQKEVAEALGLSIMTVSRALNNRSNVNPKTKKRIQEVAEKMGYMPNDVAKSLVSKRTNTIGVVIPEIGHAFFPEVVRGIDEVLGDAHYQIFLTNSSENFEKEKDYCGIERLSRTKMSIGKGKFVLNSMMPVLSVLYKFDLAKDKIIVARNELLNTKFNVMSRKYTR